MLYRLLAPLLEATFGLIITVFLSIPSKKSQTIHLKTHTTIHPGNNQKSVGILYNFLETRKNASHPYAIVSYYLLCIYICADLANHTWHQKR
jgi:hypothetical protein